jgi:hypothetical protein
MSYDVHQTPNVDQLRQWATDAQAIARHCGTGLASQLAASIQLAADTAQREESQFVADMEAEFQRLFPPLDDDVPEVLPVQPRADHEFGCEKPCCKVT